MTEDRRRGDEDTGQKGEGKLLAKTFPGLFGQRVCTVPSDVTDTDLDPGVVPMQENRTVWFPWRDMTERI